MVAGFDVVAVKCPHHWRVLLVSARIHIDTVVQKQFDELCVAVEGCQVDASQIMWPLTIEIRQHGSFEELRASSLIIICRLLQQDLRQLAIALLGQYV